VSTTDCMNWGGESLGVGTNIPNISHTVLLSVCLLIYLFFFSLFLCFCLVFQEITSLVDIGQVLVFKVINGKDFTFTLQGLTNFLHTQKPLYQCTKSFWMVVLHWAWMRCSCRLSKILIIYLCRALKGWIVLNL
jgi:hypothetical protein